MTRLTVLAPDGVPEIRQGDDLAALLVPLVDLEDGDVVAVTSKVIAKSEGRVVTGSREDLVDSETERVVARRGPVRIVRTRHGLTLASAGIDASNVERGSVVLLPDDPDASARRLREGLRDRAGRNVAVIVTDTAGRPWREGQTDIAIGAAGIRVTEDFAGRVDGHGNQLEVTAPAVADEVAGAAELAQGKLGGRPFAVVRGRQDLVLSAGDHGTGARTLLRHEGADLFGYGAREAVVRAVTGQAGDQPPFGHPASAEEVAEAVGRATGVAVTVVSNELLTCPLEREEAVTVLAFAHGWTAGPDVGGAHLRLRPRTP